MSTLTETQYGFIWNGHKIERVCSDKRRGWSVLQIKTAKDEVEAYITRTGKVRLFRSNEELLSKPRKAKRGKVKK